MTYSSFITCCASLFSVSAVVLAQSQTTPGIQIRPSDGRTDTSVQTGKAPPPKIFAGSPSPNTPVAQVPRFTAEQRLKLLTFQRAFTSFSSDPASKLELDSHKALHARFLSDPKTVQLKLALDAYVQSLKKSLIPKAP